MIVMEVALGGALGAVARYGVALGAARLLGAGFPAGTLIVNILGSALMGLATVWLMERGHPRLSPFIMVGVLGGFTTFSAFSLDTLRLIETGRWEHVAIYVLGSVVLSVAALVAAIWLARGVLT